MTDNISLANFNTSFWPFVLITFNNIPLNDSLFEDYTRSYLQLLVKCKKNKEKIYVIIDINSFNNLPIPYLLKQAQFNKKIFEYNKKHLNCAYIYCKNKLFKKIIKMYMMMEKTAVPLRIVRSLNKLNKSILDNYNIKFDSNNFFEKVEEDDEQDEENQEKENENQEIENKETESNEYYLNLFSKINDINKSNSELSNYSNEINLLED